MLVLKREEIPSLLIIILGTIDCVTTVAGIQYSGAKELNPLMASIVSTSMGAFLLVKIAATILVASIYIVANKIMINQTNTSAQSLSTTKRIFKVGYFGIIAFMFIVVANNLMTLL